MWSWKVSIMHGQGQIQVGCLQVISTSIQPYIQVEPDWAGMPPSWLHFHPTMLPSGAWLVYIYVCAGSFFYTSVSGNFAPEEWSQDEWSQSSVEMIYCVRYVTYLDNRMKCHLLNTSPMYILHTQPKARSHSSFWCQNRVTTPWHESEMIVPVEQMAVGITTILYMTYLNPQPWL